MAKTSAPATAIIRKRNFQLKQVIAMPARVGPMAGANIMPTPKIPMLTPRFSGGVIASTKIMESGSSNP